MNERIKELDKQARIFSHENGGWRISTHVPDDFKEKFAELIIKEMCANVIQPYMSRFPEDCELVIKMKKYFGVE